MRNVDNFPGVMESIVFDALFSIFEDQDELSTKDAGQLAISASIVVESLLMHLFVDNDADLGKANYKRLRADVRALCADSCKHMG